MNIKNPNRREFLNFLGKTGVSLAAASLPISSLKGCGEINYGDWVPSINRPYHNPRFFSQNATSGSSGHAGFYDGDGTLTLQFKDDFSGSGISGLEATLWRDFVSGEGFVSVADPARNYMPGLTNIPDSSFGMPPNSSNSRQDSLIVGLNLIPAERAYEIVRDYFVSKVEDSLPTPEFRRENLGRSPLFLYRGHWSFDDFHRTVNLAKHGSLVLKPVDGGSSFALLSKIGSLMGSVGDAIDFINDVFPGSSQYLTRDRKYPIYTPIQSAGIQDIALNTILYSNTSVPRNEEEEIKDLIPIFPGNSWTFSDGRAQGSSYVEGTKVVKGRHLTVLKDISGVEEYVGFEDDSFFYVGMKDPQLGEIFFEPAIKMGDKSMREGRKIENRSRIISPDSGISGTMNSVFDWRNREDVVLSDLSPYGDCFRAFEGAEIDLRKGDKRFSNSMVIEHWFARNLGKVKMNLEGQNIELVSAEINPQENVTSSSNALTPKSSLYGPSLFPMQREIARIMRDHK